LLALAGCEPVDDSAATRQGLELSVISATAAGRPGVFVDTGETTAVMDGCAKTTFDAMKILQDNARAVTTNRRAQAPRGRGAATEGPARPSTFVLNPARWRPRPGLRTGAPDAYLTAGKADESAIFRAALSATCPAQGV
jgi:hypothetical protein